MNDYQRILNLLGRYGQTVDEWPRKPEDYAALFAEDGRFTDNGVTIEPREKILSLMRRAAEGTREQPRLEGTRHLQLNPVIEVEGDRGTGSVDLMVLELSADHGWRVRGSGRYRDEYVRDQGGTWRFQSRALTWFKDLGPDPLNPRLGDAYARLFQSVMNQCTCA